MYYTFVWASGILQYGRKVPEGAIMVAGYKTVEERENIEVGCRLAYDNKTYLVPGLPEARKKKKKLRKLVKWMQWRKLDTSHLRPPQN